MQVSAENLACSTSKEYHVEITESPIISISDTIKTCGDMLNLTLSTQNNYEWFFNDELVSNENEFSINASGIYQIKATNEDGCHAGKEFNVILNTPIELNFPDTVKACDSLEIVVEEYPNAMFLWSNGSEENSVKVLRSGLLGLEVEDQNKCTTKESFYVEIYETPVFELGPDIQKCSESIKIDKSNLDFDLFWSTGDTSNMVSINNSGILKATAVRAGCSFRDSIKIVLNQPPEPDFELSQICEDQTIELSPLEEFISGNTYLWEFGDGTFSNKYHNEKSYDLKGEYTVKLIVETKKGCKETITKTIEVIEKPFVDFASSKHCYGDSIEFFGTGIEDANLYNWDFDDGTYSSIRSPKHYYEKPGKYDVLLSVKNNNGCVGFRSAVVQVYPLPEVDLTSQVENCIDEIILEGGDASNTFLWSTGSTEQSIQVNQSGDYEVLVENEFGCSTTDNVFVNISDEPDLLVNDTSVCGSLKLIPAVNDAIKYSWSNGSEDSQIEVFESDEYQLRVITSDLCIWEDSTKVEVNLIPVVDLGPDIKACEGEDIELTASHPVAKEIVWSSGDFDDRITLKESKDIWVELRSKDNCTYRDSLSVIFHPKPDFFLNDSIFACGKVSVSTGLTPDYIHNWSNGSIKPEITVKSEGLYWVEVVNKFGCKTTDSVFLNVYPLPNIDLGSDVQICFDSSYQIHPKGNFQHIEWSNGKSENHLTVNQTGIYWARVTDENECINSDTLFVKVRRPINLDLGEDQLICSEDQSIIIEPENSYQRYSWQSSTGKGGNKKSFIIDEPGEYWLSVTDDLGCTGYDTISFIETNQKIEANFLIPSIAATGDKVNFSLLTEPLPKSVQWSFGDGGSSQIDNPVYTYFREGEFEVRLLVSNGICSDELSKMITIDKDYTSGFEDFQGFVEIFKANTFPNPNDGKFLLDIELSEESPMNVKIFTLTGFKIYDKSYEVKQDKLQIDISDQLPNTYIMMIQTGSEIVLKRILKSR